MYHLFSISGHAQYAIMNSSFLQALDTDTQGFDPVFTANELMHNTRYWASGVQRDVDLTLNFLALRRDEGNVLKLIDMYYCRKKAPNESPCDKGLGFFAPEEFQI